MSLLFLCLILYFPVEAAEIHQYIKQQDTNKVSSFLSKSGNPNLPDKQGYPPLYFAIKSNNIPIAELLIKHGANVNAQVITTSYTYIIGSNKKEEFKKKCSIIFALPSLDALKMAELLLKNGANANARCIDDETILHQATFSGHMPMIKLLVKYKADINLRGGRYYQTPLHVAVQRQYEGIIRFFTQNRVDTNIRTRDANTPLHIASSGQNINIVKLLLFQEKTDINAKNRLGNTPLHIAFNRASPNQEIVKLLKSKGANENITNDKGRKPKDMLKKWTPSPPPIKKSSKYR